MSQVVVVGAGVSGLSSAIRLLEQGHSVQVIAKAFTPNTTSDISAAMWWPFHAQPEEKVLDWCMASYDEFLRLSQDPATGVVMRHGTFGFGTEIPTWAVRIPGGVSTPKDELPDDCAAGITVDAPLVEMNRYMPWLMQRATGLGAQMVQQEAKSIEQVAHDADVVVNTTGLGARELVGDHTLFPARGRAIRLEQVGVEEFVGSEVGEWPMHVFPRAHDIVVGGTYEANIESVDDSPEVDDRIVARAVAAEPRLADARRIIAITGFRPSRFEVRLESEIRNDIKVVHNYGHGGGGVTLSWGCADDVAQMVG